MIYVQASGQDLGSRSCSKSIKAESKLDNDGEVISASCHCSLIFFPTDQNLACRPVTKAVVLRLEASIDKAEESGASQHLLDLARAAAASSMAEVACADQLRESTASHSSQGTHEELQLLEATIKEAQAFYRLEVSLLTYMAPD